MLPLLDKASFYLPSRLLPLTSLLPPFYANDAHCSCPIFFLMTAPSSATSTTTRWFWKSSQDTKSSGQKQTSSSILGKTPNVFKAFRSGYRTQKVVATRAVAETSTSSSSDVSISSSSSSYEPQPEQERSPPTIKITATSHSNSTIRPAHSSVSSSITSTSKTLVSPQKRFRLNDPFAKQPTPVHTHKPSTSTTLGPSSGNSVMRKMGLPWMDSSPSEQRHRSQTVGGRTLGSLSV